MAPQPGQSGNHLAGRHKGRNDVGPAGPRILCVPRLRLPLERHRPSRKNVLLEFNPVELTCREDLDGPATRRGRSGPLQSPTDRRIEAAHRHGQRYRPTAAPIAPPRRRPPSAHAHAAPERPTPRAFSIVQKGRHISERFACGCPIARRLVEPCRELLVFQPGNHAAPLDVQPHGGRVPSAEHQQTLPAEPEERAAGRLHYGQLSPEEPRERGRPELAHCAPEQAELRWP